MHMLKVRIAEHHIWFTTRSDGIMEQLQMRFAANVIESEAESVPMMEPELRVTIESGYGVAFETYDVSVTDGDRGVLFDRSDYRIEVDPHYRTAVLRVYDDFALKHALINLYSSFIANRGWGLLIHSSCVIDGDGAYLFAGPSGAGKSTVAWLSAPRTLLSDEATIVKVAEDGVTVYNSPFRSDTKPPHIHGCYPLAGIYLLHQAAINQHLRLGAVDGSLRLMNRIFYWSAGKADTQKLLKLIWRLGEKVPMGELHFQKNDSFWEVVV